MFSNNNNNIEGQPPPAKRQRRSLGASDRVVLDVGGTKFITSASTLTSNSAYFASLLSDNWIESDNNGDDEIFIDQDPVPFRVLLAYMRQGSIEIDDINTKVVLLAEFLGIERLLLAIKVRWYCNIGKGPVHNTDEEIAVAFDQEHGGIMKAISSGLFQYFLKQNDIDAEKEFAVLRFFEEEVADRDRPLVRYNLKEVGKSGPEHTAAGISAALSGLHLKGYTHYESQLRTKESYTFSRKKHAIATMSSGATDIFIPNDNETVVQEGNNHVKQFAGVVMDSHGSVVGIAAPAEFSDDESKRSNPLDGAVINNPGSWLEDNGFVTRENAYEDIFRDHFKADFPNEKVSIFSRVISKSRDDASW